MIAAAVVTASVPILAVLVVMVITVNTVSYTHLNRFLDNHPELSHCQRSEFADDGYTGTNFHRPQFTQMMEKVKRGEIDLICVKDFSRFSRDYIETGNYLECTFPFMGVRFISINDGYDSNDYKGTTGGLEVVMRSIIYAEMCIRDSIYAAEDHPYRHTPV